jgi:ketosteroid isomerase-like protein
MSLENVEIVRRSIELWLGGDLDAWLATLDPNVGWDISTHPLPDVPNHGRGRDALVTDLLATYMSGWNDYSAELKQLVDGGDRVVAVLRETATMRDTGVALDRDLVQLWTVRDGRGSFLRVFRTKAEALEAAGLSGQAMSQENVEIVRELNEAFEARDIDAFVNAHHPYAEARNLRSQIVGPYRGHAGIRRMAEETFEMAPDFEIQIDEIRDCGSRVLVLGRQRGTVGGVPIDEVLAELYELEAGKVTRSQDFATVEQAVEAAGLSE